MLRIISRRLCTALSAGEKQIVDTLRKKFPDAQVNVQDVSGGCGAMYEVFISDVTFKGMPLLKQHQLVKQVLKHEIKDMHGIRIMTKSPEK